MAVLEPFHLAAFPGFRRRLRWFLDHGSAYGARVETQTTASGTRRLLSLVGRDRLRRILDQLLDPERFLSDHGIRSISRAHREKPFVVPWRGSELRVDYEPAESRSALFGGNSNWRGPVWFPVNFLLIESLQKFHHFFGDSLTVEFPKGSGRQLNLWQVSEELSRRLAGIFLAGPDGRRPAYGGVDVFRTDPTGRTSSVHECFLATTAPGSAPRTNRLDWADRKADPAERGRRTRPAE